MRASATGWLVAAGLALSAGVASGQPAVIGAGGQRQCAVCHLRWADDFEHGEGPLLIERPPDSVVADEDTCLGCHDGSVGDSRVAVWREHGHKTGVPVPRGMKVPRELPLTDGKIACRTCHSAHGGRAAETLANVVFLRMPDGGDALCRSCHASAAGGPDHAAHPTGPIERDVPELLTSAGGQAGKDGRTLTCRTCHAPHGAGADHLLLVEVGSSELCLACHGRFAPRQWRPGVSGEHPPNPPLQNQAQRDAIQRMGTRVGVDDTLICLSCHRMHQGRAGSHMLADSLADGRFCLSCHPQRKAVLATAHDLRRSAPDEKNIAGLTPEQSGPCGSCHSFHRFSRKPAPAPFDPTGLCATCHQPGQCAQKASPAFSHPAGLGEMPLPPELKLPLYPNAAGGPFDELRAAPRPSKGGQSIACLSCHDPHEAANRSFLRDKPDALCSRCHPDHAAGLGGAHDFTDQPDAVNGRGDKPGQAGRCGFCHAVHDAPGLALWAATEKRPASPDQMCTQCHRTGGPAKARPAPALGHPTGPKRTGAVSPVLPISLPLFDRRARRTRDGFVTCSSCHDVHGDSRKQADLLRRAPGQPVSSLCVQCHAEQGWLARGSHDARPKAKDWPKAAAQADDLCMSCHRAHAAQADDGLWTVAAPAQADPADAACLGCHPSQAAPADPAKPTLGSLMHPVELADASAEATGPGAPGPLAPADRGKAVIACRTCHNPHAPRGTTAMLRTAGSLEPATLCFRCHGEQRAIEQSAHSRKSLGDEDAAVCGPCHATHATKASRRELLWAVPEVKVEGDRKMPASERACRSCHRTGGKAKMPAYEPHPKVALPTGSSKEGITCRTCHLTHGRPGEPAANLQAADPRTAEAMRSASRPMLRPGAVADACAVCHGPDALRRYLYYHQPDKRRRTHFWTSPRPQ